MMLNYLYLGMTSIESNRQLFLYLYQQLKQDELIKKRIQKMISYREKRLANVEMKMEDKLLVMKESNVIAIIQFMQKLFKKEFIVDYDLKLFNE